MPATGTCRAALYMPSVEVRLRKSNQFCANPEQGIQCGRARSYQLSLGNMISSIWLQYFASISVTSNSSHLPGAGNTVPVYECCVCICLTIELMAAAVDLVLTSQTWATNSTICWDSGGMGLSAMSSACRTATRSASLPGTGACQAGLLSAAAAGGQSLAAAVWLGRPPACACIAPKSGLDGGMGALPCCVTTCPPTTCRRASREVTII